MSAEKKHLKMKSYTFKTRTYCISVGASGKKQQLHGQSG
jgi:hypothetical protein